jgi:hypothetical protein
MVDSWPEQVATITPLYSGHLYLIETIHPAVLCAQRERGREALVAARM